MKAQAGLADRRYIRCDAHLEDDPAVTPSNIEGRARSIQLEDSEKVRFMASAPLQAQAFLPRTFDRHSRFQPAFLRIGIALDLNLFRP
ncbi:MAG: hypothetical protein ACJ0RQ_13600 [Candidatus Azotimanducaceae bacterium]